MLEFYPQIKHVHVMAILCSGALFLLRGMGLLAGMRWPMAAAVRYTSYSIDTVLLTAAMMLLTILPGALYANGWLMTKLGLLLCYIVLGWFAFRPQRRRGTRALLLAAAGLAYVQIYFIARSHHPAGLFFLWFN